MIVDRSRVHVLFNCHHHPVCCLKREEQEDATRNVVHNNKSMNRITSLESTQNIGWQATHSLLTALFPGLEWSQSFAHLWQRERASHNVLACEHTNTHTHSPFIHALVTCADINKKRDRRLKSFSLFSKDGMASLPRYVSSTQFMCHGHFMLQTWVDCHCYYRIALNFRGSLISRIFSRLRKYSNENFWYAVCSVRVQQIHESISMKSSKIAIHENLDPWKFSAIRYLHVELISSAIQTSQLYTEIKGCKQHSRLKGLKLPLQCNTHSVQLLDNNKTTAC